MFASICRRRLVLHFRQISGGGGTNPLLSIPVANGHFSAAVSTAPSSEPCATTISYLVSRGLSPAAAASAVVAARNIRICSTDKADAVCALLRQYGFTDADISRLVRSAPMLLIVDPQRIIRPKLDFFVSLGYEPRRLSSVPFLLARSLDKHLVPSIQFLRGILGTDDKICASFSRIPRALMVDLDNNMRPAVEALRLGGLSEESISRLLIIHLGVLMVSPDRIRGIFEDLKAIGMDIRESRFLYCFRAMSSLKRETWLRKLEFFRSFGLSEDEVIKAFKTQPTMMLFSDESMNRKIRFFLDEVKLGISDIISRPVVLGYSLEKAILPRCAVLSVLMRAGKIKRDINLLRALLGSSSNFSARYVNRHANDVPDVVKAYEGKIKFVGFSGAT